ncbi:MAG: hypothetical protein KKC46_19205 [Proteobacteria bacterium]|nr:hypothetical protein [Pseudomonadota bacterium]
MSGISRNTLIKLKLMKITIMSLEKTHYSLLLATTFFSFLSIKLLRNGWSPTTPANNGGCGGLAQCSADENKEVRITSLWR